MSEAPRQRKLEATNTYVCMGARARWASLVRSGDSTYSIAFHSDLNGDETDEGWFVCDRDGIPTVEFFKVSNRGKSQVEANVFRSTKDNLEVYLTKLSDLLKNELYLSAGDLEIEQLFDEILSTAMAIIRGGWGALYLVTPNGIIWPDNGDSPVLADFLTIVAASELSPQVPRSIPLEHDHTAHDLIVEDVKSVFADAGFNDIAVLYSPKRHFAGAVFVVGDIHGTRGERITAVAEDLFDGISPIVEAAYWRTMFMAFEILYNFDVQDSDVLGPMKFRKLFSKMCRTLRVDGATLFRRDNMNCTAGLSVAEVFPSKRERISYPYDSMVRTPTLIAAEIPHACYIPDVEQFRVESNVLTAPVYPDLQEDVAGKSILYVPHLSENEDLYLLRCTRDLVSSPNGFNVFDIRLAEFVIKALSSMHMSLERDNRLMEMLNLVSHDVLAKLFSMINASRTAQAHIRNRSDWNPTSPSEEFHKCNHVVNQGLEVKRLVNRLVGLRTADEPVVKNATGFLLYGDLIKPINEQHIRPARKKNIEIHTEGKKQIGRLFLDIADFERIYENIIGNAVKYTYPKETISVRLLRADRGGTIIRVASKSIPVMDGEETSIFHYGIRGRAARDTGASGHGIGLAACNLLIAKYGGSITFRCEGGLNVFRVFIPKHWFFPPGDSSDE